MLKFVNKLVRLNSILLILISINSLNAQHESDNLITLKNQQIIWEQGVLKLQDGRFFKAILYLTKHIPKGPFFN